MIELRRKFLGDDRERYHPLRCSVLDNAWLARFAAPSRRSGAGLDAVSSHRQRPFLFLAEGVFLYLEGAQVKSLVLTLRDRFPGAELVFDPCSPLHLWVSNLQFSRSKLSARFKWGIWSARELEGWADGIRLVDEWGFFDRPEPRLARVRWMHPIESLIRTMRICQYQLGKAAG